MACDLSVLVPSETHLEISYPWRSACLRKKSWWGTSKRMESGSSQWCRAVGQEEKSKKWCTGISTETWGRSSFLCRWNIAQGWLWNLPHWRTLWPQPSAMCSRMTLLQQGGWTRWPPVVPSNLTCSLICNSLLANTKIQWFCYLVSSLISLQWS